MHFRRRSHRPPVVEPERIPESFKGWEGYWLAVKDGEVLAAGHTALEVAAKMREAGPQMEGAVIRYYPKPSSVITIGVG